VRPLLAAYRRDDWSTDEIAAVSAHLAGCADCRAAEAAYRVGGERLRQLPSITPPPDFRAAVFAAIRADQQRLSPAAQRAARAATSPALPVVRPTPISRRRRVAINPRAALAIAAAILLMLFTARAVPGLTSLDRTAASLTSSQRHTAPVQAASYALGSSYVAATSVVATTGWLVFSAATRGGGHMLVAEERRTQRATPLLSAETAAPLTVHAATDRWVIWSSGASATGGWSLYASALPAAGGLVSTSPQTLFSSSAGGDAPATLGGVWAEGTTALVAGATSAGTGVLWQVDLSSGMPVTTLLTRGSATGHLFTDPSRDGGVTYWADVWFDDGSGLHGAVWRRDAAGQPREATDESAFHPSATAGALVWVEVAPQALARMSPAAGTPPADADQVLLNQLNGSLQARDVKSGRQWQVSDRADVASVARGGSLVLWRSDSQSHVYDLHARASSPLEAQVRGAALVTLSASSLVWQSSGSAQFFVYDLK
jgi:hypothetical protein